MKITKEDLEWAAESGVIERAQADALWAALERRREGVASFGLGHVIYYLGGLVVISSMSWFMVNAWENLGGGGILAVSLVYALGFVLAGRTLWARPGLRIPGGILVTAAVWMTPLAVYGFQRLMSWWPGGSPGIYADYYRLVLGQWIGMEVATVIVAVVALRLFRFPFVTFPAAFALWYLSMDLAPFVSGQAPLTFDERKLVSLVFGAVVLIVGYVVDLRARRDRARLDGDFAFWLYLFGLAAFWGGLSLMESGHELDNLFYCLINLGLVFLSVFLDRRAFIVFGAIGVFMYVGHLAHSVFKDSLLFPFALSLLGIGIIFLGLQYQRRRARLEAWVLAKIPPPLRAWRP
jgi:hypothetical protein